MQFVLRSSARAFATVSIASFLLSAMMWGGSVGGRDAPGDLQVEPAVHALGELAPGAVVPVIFNAFNKSSHQVRIIGLNEVCTAWGCVRAKNLPCVVRPHGRADIELSVLTTDRAHETALVFEREIALHSDCPGKTFIPLRISGKVIPDGARQ